MVASDVYFETVVNHRRFSPFLDDDKHVFVGLDPFPTKEFSVDGMVNVAKLIIIFYSGLKAKREGS